MNITQLVKRDYDDVINTYEEKTVDMFMQLARRASYRTLMEINRLNFPAFTIINDNDLSKRGFVNMFLNMMVDKDDEIYGKLHFTEYKAYHEGEPSIKRIYEDDDKNWLLVQLDNGRFDIAKNVWIDGKKEKSVWKNQDGKFLDNVLNWRAIYPNGEV